MERTDGYINSIIGHGYKMQKQAKPEIMSNEQLDELFSYNGLFNKIITAPAEEAVRTGFTLKEGETEIEDNKKLASICEDLSIQDVFAQALAWDRLYGGCVILMMIDDGGDLSEPVNYNKIKKIERLEIFEPYNVSWNKGYDDSSFSSYGKPETYILTGYWGNQFVVHESRLLKFDGGKISSRMRKERDGWGGRVIDQLSKALNDYDEGMTLSVSALGKLSQGILKLEGLSDIMQNPNGEAMVQKRLTLIDYARHLMNTIAIDTADDYDQKNISISGIKELLQEYQTALSAVTNIPITVLFGRSPAGQNATGESDLENYYNLIGRLQEIKLKPQLTKLLNIVGICGEYKLNFPAEYNICFNPLWNDSEKEIAEAKKTYAEAMNAEANASKTFMEIGALDAMEVRNKLIKDNEYEIDASLDATLAKPAEEME